MSQENVPLGSRLKTLRLSRQKKLWEVAESTGITEGYLSRLEVGSRKHISEEVAGKLAEYYGVSQNWLLTGEEEDPVRLATAEYYRAIEESGLREEAAEAVHQISVFLDHFVTTDDAGRRLAVPRIVEIVEAFARECGGRNAGIREAGLKLAHANFSPYIKLMVENKGGGDNVEPMPALLENLITRATALTLRHGEQTELARFLKVTPQAVHAYLNGVSAPSAEITLQLQQWVEKKERESKSGSEGARTPSEPRTRKPRKSSEENQSPGPKGP